MKKLFFMFLPAVIFFAACNDAKFNRYPGTRLDSIPQQFRGVFIDPESKNKKKEEITIGKNYWQENDKERKKYLGDSNVISEYKGEYYFSVLNDNTFWNVVYIKPSGKEVRLFEILYDPKDPKAKNNILKYFTPVMDKDSNFIFTMDEEKLLTYTRNELMTEKPLKLKRK